MTTPDWPEKGMGENHGHYLSFESLQPSFEDKVVWEVCVRQLSCTSHPPSLHRKGTGGVGWGGHLEVAHLEIAFKLASSLLDFELFFHVVMESQSYCIALLLS